MAKKNTGGSRKSYMATSDYLSSLVFIVFIMALIK